MTQNSISKEDVDKLFLDWYRGARVVDLLQRHGIKKLPNTAFAKHFPPIYCETVCPYCYEDMLSFRSDPAHYKKTNLLYDASTAHCLNCGHDTKKATCKCEGCAQERREKMEALAIQQAERHQHREVKLQEYYEEIKPINFDEMSLSDLICLYALSYQSTCEDVSLISPLKNSESPFTPSAEWNKECIDSLSKYLFPLCEDDEILYLNSDGNLEWYTSRVFYQIKIENIDRSDFLDGLLESIRRRIANSSVSERYVLYLLYEKLMISECVVFLQNERNSYSLPHEAGEKTFALFKKLIQKWRIDQVYNFIWGRCKDAVALKVQNGLPAKLASNMIIGSIDKFVERALANNWEFKSYYRGSSNKQSAISYVMFNKILQLDGFGVEYNFEDVMTRINGFVVDNDTELLVVN